MEYYVDKHNRIIGRLYEVSSGYAAEIGRQAKKTAFGFIALKGVKCKTYKQAEKFLYENGCVSVAVA